MIAIVTDSSAYFRKEEAAALGVTVVPLNYTVAGRGYNESYSDGNGAFEQLLKSHGTRSTGHPKLAAYLSCYEEALTSHEGVLCLTISSRLSGAYGTAHQAARMADNATIVVFDSRLTAGGLYLLTKEAVRLAASGMGLEALQRALGVLRDKISIRFTVDDMNPLRHSGRIGFVRSGVSTILNLKPILLCQDGAVVADGVARGQINILKRLIATVSAATRAVVISYIGNNRLAANVYTVLQQHYPSLPLHLQKMGPVLGIHLGSQVVAVSALDM